MKRLMLFLLAMMLCVPAASAESAVRYVNGENADRVHLRAEPSAQAESLGLYFAGTDVVVYDETDSWSRIVIGSVDGWMMSRYLADRASAQLGPWRMADADREGQALLLYPDNDSPELLALEDGAVVHVLGETSDGWSYAECHGVKGYMPTRSLLDAPGVLTTQVVGKTSDGDYIHQLAAPNGQLLYFSAMEEEPPVVIRDVNFDGVSDIEVFVAMGASNFYSEFFVYDASSDAYVRVEHASDDGLSNVELYPEYGLVATYGNAGNAGLLHVWNLYRWEGNDLRLIRSAVSDEWTEDIFEGSTYTQIIHGDMLHVVVRDHTRAYDAPVVWELIIPKEAAETRDIYTEEMEALWQGIR